MGSHQKVTVSYIRQIIGSHQKVTSIRLTIGSRVDHDKVTRTRLTVVSHLKKVTNIRLTIDSHKHRSFSLIKSHCKRSRWPLPDCYVVFFPFTGLVISSVRPTFTWHLRTKTLSYIGLKQANKLYTLSPIIQWKSRMICDEWPLFNFLLGFKLSSKVKLLNV